MSVPPYKVLLVGSNKRARRPNKQLPWKRNTDDPVSVLRLALDVSDPLQRRLVEGMFSCGFKLKRALQHDARNRADAYWAARHERSTDKRAHEQVRERLGLSQYALAYAAYGHLDAAPHLRRFVTKTLAMFLANSVWQATERHLFKDAGGHRNGRARIGRWLNFTTLPGRARSHRIPHKWESFRLHGSLAGHRAAYTTRNGNFVQPRNLRQVQSASWWDHHGALAMVFTGLPDGTLVLPVRLPTAPSNRACLDYYLSDPEKWHKIDLVRHPDPNAAGGWRYEAHLMVLAPPYVSPTVAHERTNTAVATADRRAGIDVNVSNITVASHVDGEGVHITQVVRERTQRRADRRRARRERSRQRQMERSRRANNRNQYQLSKRQQKQAKRRAEAALPPRQVIPAGPRVSNAAGMPLQSHRRDKLSTTYRHIRLVHASEAEASARARCDNAREVARALVQDHGYAHVVEDCAVSEWSRHWGAATAAFTPGMLVTAIEREVAAVAKRAGSTNRLLRASTRTTAMSQHCPCGERVSKTLKDRVHVCKICGLRGDRDAVSAILASFVTLEDPKAPNTARVNYDGTRAALDEIRTALLCINSGWQGTQSESTSPYASDDRSSRGCGDDHAVVIARRNARQASCSTPDETDSNSVRPSRSECVSEPACLHMRQPLLALARVRRQRSPS